MDKLRGLLHELVATFPPDFRDKAAAYIARTEHDVRLVTEISRPYGRVLDIGGGTGLFGMVCARLGMTVTNVDDFIGMDERLVDIQRQQGVTVIQHDVLDFEPLGEVDVATSFHVLEHLHHSPKRLFHGLVDSLSSGGAFVVAGPNAANLRKRVQTPFGKVGWSSLDYWYERPVMRAHVREPLASDMSYIADDLNLTEVRVLGRNFLGRNSQKGWRRGALRIAEHTLQRWPGLCSDLYLVGRKP